MSRREKRMLSWSCQDFYFDVHLRASRIKKLFLIKAIWVTPNLYNSLLHVCISKFVTLILQAFKFVKCINQKPKTNEMKKKAFYIIGSITKNYELAFVNRQNLSRLQINYDKTWKLGAVKKPQTVNCSNNLNASNDVCAQLFGAKKKEKEAGIVT